ncbi:LIM and SH3 domain protein Lasp isoform X5 [Strongylocentrotus purpuratus]|uniref:LIM and SH3 domain protein 1 n=1 Tax=Strongylocentrotus purpuratus TaxID=7668 RepID=A0A7M7HM34_STRPU|nr:LIM and SH3 domain protein Lasp isoform X5 [Strongylocentrotus purpuratus]
MNKTCARCLRTVYPVEEMKCLDKSWHKGCFTCESCGMTLNMKNYKGYDKLPYCHAHYPTTKFTTVADTPENRRLAKNTKTQSQVEYQKQFVQDKGCKISVADDPETVRARRNTQNQSAVMYTGQLQQREQSEQHRPAPEAGTVTGFSFTRLTQRSYQTRLEWTYSGPPASKQSVGSLFDPGQKPQMQQQQMPPSAGQPNKYRAIYDYLAADQDEVSFKEGDLVVNWQHIDEGWMTGTIERTGQKGMLPSNYVQPV